jgi:hypothetical protein
MSSESRLRRFDPPAEPAPILLAGCRFWKNKDETAHSH